MISLSDDREINILRLSPLFSFISLSLVKANQETMFGGQGGFGGGLGGGFQEMASDFAINQFVPGGLNSKISFFALSFLDLNRSLGPMGMMADNMIGGNPNGGFGMGGGMNYGGGGYGGGGYGGGNQYGGGYGGGNQYGGGYGGGGYGGGAYGGGGGYGGGGYGSGYGYGY